MISETSVGNTWWLWNWHYLKADLLTWLAARAAFSWDLIWGQWLEHLGIDSPRGCLSILTAWCLGPTASALWEPGSRWIIFHDLASEVTLGHGSPCHKPAQIKWKQHRPISWWEECQNVTERGPNVWKITWASLENTACSISALWERGMHAKTLWRGFPLASCSGLATSPYLTECGTSFQLILVYSWGCKPRCDD